MKHAPWPSKVAGLPRPMIDRAMLRATTAAWFWAETPALGGGLSRVCGGGTPPPRAAHPRGGAPARQRGLGMVDNPLPLDHPASRPRPPRTCPPHRARFRGVQIDL